MKKKTAGFLAVIAILFAVFAAALPITKYNSAYAQTEASVETAEGKARSAYLVDYNTGTVLYERNADAKLPIASMVKIMTLVITFDNIEKGNMTLDQKITVSDTAAGMGGSQMFLDAGKDYTVRDLIKGIVVCSANDASVAIAETIAGTKEDFIILMNDTAKKLGMNNTVFVNVTGLPQDGQYSTAKDVTVMMRKLLSHKEYYAFSTIYMENYTHPDGRVTELVNTNKLIRFYKGCDAGKTGFTNDAMFCLSASALRSDMRVVATVIGSPDSKSRFGEVSSLFNFAFANFKQEQAVAGGQAVKTVKVNGGKSDSVSAAPERSVYILQKKGDKADYKIVADIPDCVKAPVKEGQVIGKITVLDSKGNVYDTVNVISVNSVNKSGFGDALKDVLENWFTRKKK